jgi:hypothetical protein
VRHIIHDNALSIRETDDTAHDIWQVEVPRTCSWGEFDGKAEQTHGVDIYSQGQLYPLGGKITIQSYPLFHCTSTL